VKTGNTERGEKDRSHGGEGGEKNPRKKKKKKNKKKLEKKWNPSMEASIHKVGGGTRSKRLRKGDKGVRLPDLQKNYL